MLDPAARRILDPALDRLAAGLDRVGTTPNAVTWTGFAIGLAAVPAIASDALWLGLALILANRLCDGLDGPLARRRGITDFGGYLDSVCDFLFYSAVPFAFALRSAQDAPYAALLMLSFMGTGASFLAYAALAAKHGLSSELRGKKSFYYIGGLTEGTETIVLFVLFCLFPSVFRELAGGFALLCFVTTATRIRAASELLRGH